MINESFFVGFDKTFVFFEEESENLYYFQENSIVVIIDKDEKEYIGKWRFNSKQNLLDIFIDNLKTKYTYKITSIKEDMINVVFQFKKNDEIIKKGKTLIVKNISSSGQEIALTKIDRIFISSLICLIVLILSIVLSFTPMLSKAGFLYSIFISIGITSLFYKRISIIGHGLSKKHGKKIKDLLFE